MELLEGDRGFAVGEHGMIAITYEYRDLYLSDSDVTVEKTLVGVDCEGNILVIPGASTAAIKATLERLRKTLP